MSAEQNAAREEVMKCETEIQNIKTALRRLGTSEKDGEPNSLELVMLKVEGLPEGASPNVSLQLSSPIEEGTLTKIFDPLNTDPAPEGSVVVFAGVETSMATMTLTVKDADIPLGSSAPHDLAPVCQIDSADITKEQYVTDVPFAIVAEDGSGGGSATATTSSNEGGDGTATAEAVPILPVCTITLRVTYKPSPKDQKEELYEMLNKTSQRKATALDQLRKISMAASSAGRPGGAESSTTMTKSAPGVRPGFLNKKKKEDEKPAGKLEKLYEKTVGPNSFLRKGFGVAVAAKNYIIFFGAVSFFHFKGQLLSLPPPV